MRRFVVIVALIVLFVVMTFVSGYVVPGWAAGKLQRGDELPLATQVVIASSQIWMRWFVFIAVAVALVIGWLVRSAFRREEPAD